MVHLEPGISVGNLLTTISVIVAIASLLVIWKKDRQLRKREYADRIRHAAARTATALDRLRILALRFYEDIQPLLTDADVLLTKDTDPISTRDFLWRNLVAARATSSQRISDEKVEIEYVDLYGYDPRIQPSFTSVVRRLKTADQNSYDQLLQLTQQDILRMESVRPPYESAQLGNALRATCSKVVAELERKLEGILVPFRQEMIDLISASDDSIVGKKLTLLSPVAAGEAFRTN